MVIKSTGKTQTKFQNQEFFNDFNWDNFSLGDIVWLGDYQGEVDRIAGVFVGTSDKPIIRLLPNRDGKMLAKRTDDTFVMNPTISNSYYWQKYLI